MSRRVVGIIGRAGHGKDTCAQILKEIYGFQRIALADALKRDIQECFSSFPECSIEAQNSRQRAPWVRRLQQVYGTEWCRKRLGEEYWLDRWAASAEVSFAVGIPGISVPDVRFPNEVKYLRERWGAKLLFVYRQGHQEPGVDPNHDSEKYVDSLRDEATAVVLNYGSLDDLRGRVQECWKSLWSS